MCAPFRCYMLFRDLKVANEWQSSGMSANRITSITCTVCGPGLLFAYVRWASVSALGGGKTMVSWLNHPLLFTVAVTSVLVSEGANMRPQNCRPLCYHCISQKVKDILYESPSTTQNRRKKFYSVFVNFINIKISNIRTLKKTWKIQFLLFTDKDFLKQ